MNRRTTQQSGLLLAVTACLCWASVAEAKKPEKPGRNNADYTIVDLPGPDHELNGGVSLSYTDKISHVAPDGTVFVLGTYESQIGSRPCVWTITSVDNVIAEDIGDRLDVARDINSAGIVGGGVDGQPALLFADGQVVPLAGSNFPEVVGLSNPDQLGVFQAAGKDIIWDIVIDGTVLAATPLTNPGGENLYAHDLNDFNQVAGIIVVDGEGVPAVGEFLGGQFLISLRLNPHPAEITGFWDFQIDDGGNLLGFGYQRIPDQLGVYTRAVIWPATGGAIDLGAETGITSTEGNGIALVNGVMQVVGRGDNTGSGPFAFLYTNYQMQDLGPRSRGDQPWEFDRAEDVNTSGMICGVGKMGKRRNRQIHGFLLVPNQP